MEDQGDMEPGEAAVINLKLDHIQSDVIEVKTDVREIREQSPIYRIENLEAWRRDIRKNFLAMWVGVVVAFAGAVLAWVLNR